MSHLPVFHALRADAVADQQDAVVRAGAIGPGDRRVAVRLQNTAFVELERVVVT